MSTSLNSGDFEFFSFEQNQALIDLLLLLTRVDNKISFGEQDFVDSFIDGLPWGEGISKKNYVSQSTYNARNALSTPQETSDYLDKIVSRLSTPESKSVSLQLITELANSDGNFCQAEKDFVAVLTSKIC